MEDLNRKLSTLTQCDLGAADDHCHRHDDKHQDRRLSMLSETLGIESVLFSSVSEYPRREPTLDSAAVS
ncbi:hypothetical protein EVAR_62081_1 [Eumeta japonica]|uniref:Uncharacterized protein n=1 Tax=Eumeta variegata TaxID=151549 RepID=A0A4C1Z3H7_EUMVA|nr:hypothetical protein EVAR_62081_1 [Eumeta japonica]